mgnify:CR=1 FL=1
MKELKKQTPDYECALYDKKNNMVRPQTGFKKKDVVWVENVYSLIGLKRLHGEYYFDSYDSLEKTCYISPTESLSTTFNVRLSDIKKVYNWKDTLNKIKE